MTTTNIGKLLSRNRAALIKLIRRCSTAQQPAQTNTETHFGFQTVHENEKAGKGKNQMIHTPYSNQKYIIL